VIVRGNERKVVFGDDADRHYRERFEIRLLAYCLMTPSTPASCLREGAKEVAHFLGKRTDEAGGGELFPYI